MKNKKLICAIALALAIVSTSSVVFAGGLYPRKDVPDVWEGVPFLKNGIITEFNNDNGDWSVEVFYQEVSQTVNVDVPEEVLKDLYIGQDLKFLVKDENYTSEWAGLNSDMFTQYAAALILSGDAYNIEAEKQNDSTANDAGKTNENSVNGNLIY